MRRGLDSLLTKVCHWYMFWRKELNSVGESGEPKSF